MPFNYKTQYQRYQRYYQQLAETMEKPQALRYSTAVFSFLAISLFGWYAIRPTIQTILYLKREIKDNQLVNQKMEEKIIALVEAQATYQSVEPDLPLIDQAIPTTPEVISLVSQLRNLASVSSASVSSIQVPTVPIVGDDATQSAQAPAKGAVAGTAVPASRPVGYPVSLTVSGPFASLNQFLQGLIAMRRIATVDGITFTPAKDTASSPASKPLQLTLTIKAYYLPK